MITNEIADKIFDTLVELLDIETREFQKYSDTPACSNARQGMEEEYTYHQNKARLIMEIYTMVFSSHVYPVYPNSKLNSWY